MKKSIITLGLLSSLFAFPSTAQAIMHNGVWTNDLTSLFSRNEAVIMAINIRTYNAKDANKNDIVEPEKGETTGNFINAISRLNELQRQRINTVHLLPITPVGKVKALGTAGSLYAMSAFDKINPQLDDPTNNLTPMQEAKKFIDECHKRDIRVIIDLPSCGAYDLYLERPNLFLKGKDGQPVVPADWADIRLFKVQNEDGSLNDEVYLEYKKFVDMVLNLGADGIRADVATSKPFDFWKSLISYAKSKDKEFLFLAEASESWTTPVVPGYTFTPYDKLLEAGFDGWYGSFFNFKEWKSADKLEKELRHVEAVKKEFAQKGQPKNVIGSFATHDEVSPIITGGAPFTEMIMWLQSTLPINSYYVDGFQTGDAYQYKYANQKAEKSYTDDDYYFVHKGKFDIFNYSRKPGMDNPMLQDEFTRANLFKLLSKEILNKGCVTFLKTSNEKVFAYEVNYNAATVIVILNKDLVYQSNVTVPLKGFKPDKFMVIPFKFSTYPQFKPGKITVSLNPGETCVLLLNKMAEDK